ncbi:MAG: aceF [Moraxellaceae bacterium]|nr:aceF [Moraxellaceae bacterium]
MSKQAVPVPDIGAESADVIEILVKPGQLVGAEQAIVVLESDKASMEVPCPLAGTVAEIAVQVGQRVKQGDVLLQLDTASVPEAGLLASAQASAAAAGMAAPAVPVTTIGEELHQVSEILTPPGVPGGEPQSSVSTPASPAVAATAAVAATGPGLAPSPPAAATMLTVRVPDIGADVADVIEILVREGQAITLEQPVVVLESAKASMEVPSSLAGVVQKILVKVGDKVSENSPLLQVLAQAPAETAAAPAAASAPAQAQASRESGAPSGSARQATSTTPVASPASAPSTAGLHGAALRALATAVSQATNVSVHAGPAVRRLARELGVDLAKVKGTGPRERILKEDVHAFVKQGMQQLAAGVAAPAATSAALPVIDFAKWGPVERVALTRIQRLSAQNLHRAWSTIPHVTQFDEADITGLEEFRLGQKDAFKAEGLSLTLLSFMVKACAHVLRQFPRFNSSLEPDGENLVVKRYIHIGVAVDTPNGLVVPVIRDADRKSIRDIARDLGELSAKARDKKLMPADMQGATFSISSLGGIGGTAFTPIVNWPEVAILGVSRAAMKPVWNGQEFRPRLMLPLSLSYDHRVIDGAEAARFTSALVKGLGDIRELLL